MAERADLTRRIGGPLGSHARRGGIWFDPAPWTFAVATLVWLLTLLRHQPCQQHAAGQPVNAFMRLCYSDIPILYQSSPLGSGGLPYGSVSFAEPPLAAGLVLLARTVARIFGARPVAGAGSQELVDGAGLFLTASALLLFCCLMVMVACHLLMGRNSAQNLATSTRGRLRSWDALLVAASPAVFTAGLVSWDLLGACLVSAALLAWALRRPRTSGVLFGLAISAGFWPALVLLAIGLLCARAGRMAAWGQAVLAAALVWLAVNLPVMLWSLTGWSTPITSWTDGGPDLGSVWFLLQELGVRIPALSVLVVSLFGCWFAWLLNLVRRAPRRPRLGQVAFLLVAGWLLVDKGYTPQQVLWLVPLVALARPRLGDWALWSLAEALYWWAVWGHLGGQLAPGDGGTDFVYLAAIAFRWLVLFWLVSQVAGDVRRPWEDPVRGPSVDDPIGGVLDHAPDAVPAVANPREAHRAVANQSPTTESPTTESPTNQAGDNHG